MLLCVFLTIFANWSLTLTRAKQRQQNTNKRRRSGSERKGPDTGAQVSAATQRTCTSNYGAGVCITSSPRHDAVMVDASGKGCVKRKTQL
ncbi:hypothetical protein DFH94DRAFT_18382 [Russula ochroleuca]|uniref:Secreted protein n=1 Tax=Russula ochroleuca TaxID=152965 RepID=A0A9P5N5V0_9AGAM|nr:hypothetical protein DFH94DRAFT_18382 [Russula ochroleuca]